MRLFGQSFQNEAIDTHNNLRLLSLAHVDYPYIVERLPKEHAGCSFAVTYCMPLGKFIILLPKSRDKATSLIVNGYSARAIGVSEEMIRS